MAGNRMKTKILIIEDQATMRRNVALMLEMEGYETHAAANGREGLDIAFKERPDLILCDVMMPEMDGHEVVQTLRRDAAFATTPFIFLTARTDHFDVRAGMNVGADDYLTKPVVREDLLSAIESRLLRAKSFQDALDQAGSFEIDFSDFTPLQREFGLTAREAEVLSWVAQGKGNADVASILGMSEKTAKQHLGVCFRRWESRTAARPPWRRSRC